MILSVDPGQHVGYSVWTAEGKELDRGVVEFDEFLSMLAEWEDTITKIIYEDWRLLFRQVQQTGSKMEASQVVGALKLMRALFDIELVVQSPSILPVSALHAGVKLPKGHTPDDLAAYLHGHYHFVELGILQARDID